MQVTEDRLEGRRKDREVDGTDFQLKKKRAEEEGKG